MSCENDPCERPVSHQFTSPEGKIVALCEICKDAFEWGQSRHLTTIEPILRDQTVAVSKRSLGAIVAGLRCLALFLSDDVVASAICKADQYAIAKATDDGTHLSGIDADEANRIAEDVLAQYRKQREAHHDEA